MKNRARTLLLPSIVFMCLGIPLYGQSTWDGGAGTNNWADANNWNPNGVPTSSTAVTIGSAGNIINVNIPSGSRVALRVNCYCNLTIAQGATLTVNNNSGDVHAFILNAGSVTNSGTLNVSEQTAANRSGLMLLGGTLTNNATGIINIPTSARRGLTMNGGTLSNAGTISIGNTGTAAAAAGDGIYLEANGTHSNTGTITLNANIRAYGMLQRSGTTGVFNNSGSITIRSDVSGNGVDGIYGNVTFNNTGNGSVSFSTVLGNEIGTGVTFVQNSTNTVSGTSVIDCAGTLKGSGTGSIGGFYNRNGGTTAPGASPGCLVFSGNYSTVGTLQIEINGPTACLEYDRLQVAGTATLGGTLSINFGSYMPTNGQTFQIIQAGAYSGNFSSINVVPGTIVASFSNGVMTVESGGALLPVELTYFTARPNGRSVQLDWQTASEYNHDFFEIQRSLDAKNWQVVERIAGTGNSSSPKDYSALDESPFSGTSYYRLRQVDTDRQFEYSPVRTVHLSDDQEATLTIYPNPSDQLITINGTSGNLGNIRLYNKTGKEMTPFIQIISAGSSQYVVNISSLPSGMYFVKHGWETYKLYKQ